MRPDSATSLSRFRHTLCQERPRHRRAGDYNRPDRAGTPGDARPMPQTILVVDDERDIVELVRYNLAQAGYRVVSATDGRQAVEMGRAE